FGSALFVSGCGGRSVPADAPEPAAVVRAVGADTLRITLSTASARRLDVRTAVVREVHGEASVPYSALLYAATGQAYIYVRAARGTFEQRAVAVDRIVGSSVLVLGGLERGERVATAAAAELQGIELQAGGGNPVAPVAQAFDPSAFGESATVDNRWLPLRRGTQLVYAGTSNDGARRLVFTVTDLVKVVGGVRNAVVWDRDFVDGKLVEAELAFFAQDDLGNVWHTGEYPEEDENGKSGETPAWPRGGKGGRAGGQMPPGPQLGSAPYEQGYAPPPVNWTDHAQVYRTGAKTCVPVRCYSNVLVTREFNPGDPGAQLKYFAPGLGNIRVGWVGKDPDRERLRLVKVVRLGTAALASARARALSLEAPPLRPQTAGYRATAPAEGGEGPESRPTPAANAPAP